MTIWSIPSRAVTTGLVVAALSALSTNGPASPPTTASHARPQVTAFLGVTVVPMVGDRELPDHTVLVRGRRIEAVGPSALVEIPQDALRIDGNGRWLAPGLVDTHVHLFSRTDLQLYLANGVTTIVNLGGYGAADSILSLRDEVSSGGLQGPTVYTSGNWLDGDPPFRGINTVVRDPDEARAEVRREFELGFDFIKLYEQLDPDTYAAIVAEARRLGMPVTGHVPNAVGVDGVLRSGQDWIAHAGDIVFRELGFRADDDAVERLARRVQRSGVAVTTTLWMTQLAFEQRRGPEAIAEVAARPEMRFLPPERRAAWRDDNMFARFPRVSAEEGEARLALARRFVAALVDAGAIVLAGTDADVAGSVPGFSIHEELRNLVEAGLSPYEALRAATSAPGAFLGQVLHDSDSFGAVVTGARADLLLLEADPLDDLSNLRRPVGVMVAGAWFPAGDLAGMLEARATTP
jgi:imidazolonepropionase-like amidohydrolase